MAKNVTDKLADAGRSVGDAARKVGQKIADGTDRAVDAVSDAFRSEGTDSGVGGIHEHMQVIASCGKCVGTVDSVDGNTIKLTRKDSPDGQHHFIPTNWVDHVDRHVHLSKDHRETELNWR